MDILFTDLDNTLIYSKKIDIEDKISVEIYDGDDNSLCQDIHMSFYTG